MPRDPAVARTERLVLRPWTYADEPRLLDIHRRPEVTRWLGDGPPRIMKDLGEAHQRVLAYADRDDPPLGVWAIEVAEGPTAGLVAGSVLLVPLPNGDGEVEIGWHLHPDCWGHGYATEAATAILRRGFEGMLPEILALTHVDNTPSQAVCRRLGLRDDGVVEKWYLEPSQLFRLTRRDWLERSR